MRDPRFAFLGCVCWVIGGALRAAPPTPEPGRQIAGSFTDSADQQLRYWLYAPQDFDAEAPQRYPLMLFLHGSGECGDDLGQVKQWGPPKLVETGALRDFPFVLVSPQCPAGQRWRPDLLAALIDDVMSHLPIDSTRVYVTGLSMGGSGTWELVARYPGKFAAAAPICGSGDPKQAARLRSAPIWAFHGDSDDNVPLQRSQEMVDAIHAAGGLARLTIYPGVGHNAWTPTYANGELYRWLLSQRRRPNIVCFLADDLGYGELGCYGQKIIRTPHLDRIAAEGMRFTQFYCGSPVCAPSRCTLMTGKHTGHAFIRDNGELVDPEDPTKSLEGQLPLSADETTIGELLQARGYATAAIGKWGLGMTGTSGDPTTQGFDQFFGYYCQRHAHNHFPRYLWRNQERVELKGNTRGLTGEHYSQDLFTDEALKFVREHRDEPFFLYLPFAVPHLSIQVPEDALAQYQDVIVEEDYEHRGYLRHPTPRAGYAAMISHLDGDIGKIMELLQELHLDQNTLVMFSSDNGPTYNRLGGSDSDYFHSAGGLRGLKGSVYEGGIRVPLLARWPGRIAPHSVSGHAAAFYDLLPTWMDLVQAAAFVPAEIDGLSFARELTGGGAPPLHEYLYWEFSAYGGQQAIRWGNWKGVRQRMLSQANLEIALYNLQDDPQESDDLAAEHPEIVERLRHWMTAAHCPSAEFPFPPLDAPSAIPATGDQ